MKILFGRLLCWAWHACRFRLLTLSFASSQEEEDSQDEDDSDDDLTALDEAEADRSNAESAYSAHQTAKNKKAPSTKANYARHQGYWSKWCAKKKISPTVTLWKCERYAKHAHNRFITRHGKVMSQSEFNMQFKALKALFLDQKAEAQIGLARATSDAERAKHADVLSKLNDPMADGYSLSLREELIASTPEALRGQLNSIRRTDITPDDHRNVAIKIMSTNGPCEAIRTLVLWSWIGVTGLRGGSFAPAKLGHFSYSKVLYSGCAHSSPLRGFAYNTFGDKTRRRGERIERQP